MAIGETLVLAPEYSRAKSGAAHLFALLEKKPTIDSHSQEGTKTVRKTMILFIYLFGQAHSMWKFLGQASNPSHSRGKGPFSESLTTRPLRNSLIFF